MSHSKRNTSLAFFTSYERSQLKGSWGSQSTRLTRDSFLPFASCQLCLLPSVDPVACGGGPIPATETNSRKRRRIDEEGGGQQCHIFCRECALANLLQQKKEMKRAERERELAALEQVDADARDDDEARARAVEDFERVQMGLEARHARPVKDDKVDEEKIEIVPVARRIGGPGDAGAGDASTSTSTEQSAGGKKRKFELDDAELARIAAAQQGEARKALSDERAAQAKARELPSFWAPAEKKTPSTTADGALTPGEETKLKAQPVCPGATTADTAHPLSLKTLTAVAFSEEVSAKEGDEGRKTRACPACSKPLNNASRAVLARPCGHVVCGECIERFVLGRVDDVGRREVVRCFVCSADLGGRKKGKGKDGKEGKDRIRPGLMEICSEGTGFAGGGKNVVKKGGTAFQC